MFVVLSPRLSWQPNPTAAKALRVHRFRRPAKCHSTVSGAAQRSSCARRSTRPSTAPLSVWWMVAQSRTTARRVGRICNCLLVAEAADEEQGESLWIVLPGSVAEPGAWYVLVAAGEGSFQGRC